MQYGENISLLRKDRANRRGGGVAIAYDNKKVKAAEYQLAGSSRNQEIIAAVVKDIASGIELFVVTVYLPPSMGRADVKKVTTVIAEHVAQIKAKKPEIRTLIGGDFNKKKFDSAVEDFPLIKLIQTGPTRGRRKLDLIYTDVETTSVELMEPIETEEGVPSDHRTILCPSTLSQAVKNTTSYFSSQPVITKGQEKFAWLLVATDWAIVAGNSCSDSADNLARILDGYVKQCFPMKRHKVRSRDPPWITADVRRKTRKKNRT